MRKSPHSVGNFASATRSTDRWAGELGQTSGSIGTSFTLQGIDTSLRKIHVLVIKTNGNSSWRIVERIIGAAGASHKQGVPPVVLTVAKPGQGKACRALSAALRYGNVQGME